MNTNEAITPEKLVSLLKTEVEELEQEQVTLKQLIEQSKQRLNEVDAVLPERILSLQRAQLNNEAAQLLDTYYRCLASASEKDQIMDSTEGKSDELMAEIEAVKKLRFDTYREATQLRTRAKEAANTLIKKFGIDPKAIS